LSEKQQKLSPSPGHPAGSCERMLLTAIAGSKGVQELLE